MKTLSQYIQQISRKRLWRKAFIASMILMTASHGMAASATWTGGPGSWATAGSWTLGGPPGATTGTTSPDVATFNDALGGAIVVDANRNVSGINFDGNVGSYTFNTGPLLLSAGGTTQLLSSVTSTGQTETITTPITLEGAYTFANNSANDTLSFGAITLGSAASSVLTLSGSNTGANSITGPLANASGTIKLGVTKSGAGTWTLSGANTYTGATVINGGGRLILDSTTGSLASVSVLTLGGGTFDYRSSDALAHTQTIAALSTVSGANTIMNEELSTGTSALTITSLGTRGTGSTVNFAATPGGAATFATPGTITTGSAGYYYNGADYAITSGGAIRAINYGVDASTFIIAPGASFMAANGSTSLLQGNATLSSGNSNTALKFASGASTVTINPSTFLASMLVSGGVTTVNSTGALRPQTGNGEMLIRTDLATDQIILNLTINSTNGLGFLNKSGLGTLKLTGANTVPGNIYANEGTVMTTNSTGLGFGGATAVAQPAGTTQVAQGATVDLSSSTSNIVVNEPIILAAGASLINSSATGLSTIDNGVAGITVNTVGAGYTSAPTVQFNGTTVAGVTTTLNGAVLGTTTTGASASGNYATAPTVTFTGGGATTQATGTAVLSSVTLNGATTIGGAGGLQINAVVSGAGSFNKTGAGTLNLTGANTFTGGSSVSGGSLLINNTVGSALGTGAFSVARGSTFGGTGIATGLSSFALGTGTTGTTTVQVGAGGTDTTSSLTLQALGASTITATNLALNVDSLSSLSNLWNVGSTPLTFSSTSLSLNIVGAGTLPAGRSYLLIDGTSNAQYSGLVFNPSTGVINTALSGLNFSFSDPSYNASSFLVLSNGDISVSISAVPEPGMWMMMIGGLVGLVVVVRRRDSQRA